MNSDISVSVKEVLPCILNEDIEQRYSIRYKAAFENMVHHILNNAPTKLGYKGFQKLFGLRSDHTAENYVMYAKNAYIIRGIKKFSYKSTIRIRDEKAYAVDVALMNNRENALSGENLGWRLETIIFIELLRRYRPLECDIYYYYETAGEADFVVCRGKTVLQIIQVSYDISNEKTLKREIKGLLLAFKATRCDNLLIITDHEDKLLTEEGKKINVVPAYAWLVDK